MNRFDYDGYRECEVERACFQMSQIPIAKQDRLEYHNNKMLFESIGLYVELWAKWEQVPL